MKIDAHHHLWHYTPEQYGWIDGRMKVLRRDFLPADMENEMACAGVRRSIAVQARQTMEETHWLLALAAESSMIRGVVGWAPINAGNFISILKELQQSTLLKGLRHVVQDESSGFLGGEAFNRGIRAMRDTGMVYELLIVADQLSEAISFVDRHPRQLFVLDHLAKPNIAGNGFDMWNRGFSELARRGNVVCKLSGMVTEADWRHWTPTILTPYFYAALEAFGPSRLMAGSDWPVITVACSYARWWQIIADWLAPLTIHEREQIEGGTAARVYGLSIDAHPKEATT